MAKLLFVRKFYLSLMNRASTSLKSYSRKVLKDPPYVDDGCGPNSIVYITNPITRGGSLKEPDRSKPH
jgi:hypothetical protein